MDVVFPLFGRWIFVGWMLILVVWTLDFGWVDVEFWAVDVGFRLGGCWILFEWTLDFY